jgi:sec-independent protein translocase protein TatB
MPSIGPMEILVVGVIALIVFGPQKLPEIARSIGRTASELRRMASEVRDEFEAGVNLEDRDEVKDEEEEKEQGAQEEEEDSDLPETAADEAATSTAPQTNKVVDAPAATSTAPQTNKVVDAPTDDDHPER